MISHPNPSKAKGEVVWLAGDAGSSCPSYSSGVTVLVVGWKFGPMAAEKCRWGREEVAELYIDTERFRIIYIYSFISIQMERGESVRRRFLVKIDHNASP